MVSDYDMIDHRYPPPFSIVLPLRTPMSLFHNRSTPQSCTPLHYAAGAGDLGLCKRLVEAGAKASTCDFYNYTAVDYAKQSGAGDCIAYLEEFSKQKATTAGKPHVSG